MRERCVTHLSRLDLALEHAVTVPIAYDVTRLFYGPLSRTPRGIDRVDFALAARLFRHSAQPCVGIMPTLQGMRVFDKHAVRRGLFRLQKLWAERRSAEDDAAWQHLIEELHGERLAQSEALRSHQFGYWERAKRMASLISATGFQLGASAKDHVPERAVYVNVGHISLAMPFYLRWLNERPDVTPVFMLHDVIPLDTPQYVSASSARHHATMVASTARYAAGLLVTTTAAQMTVEKALKRFGRNDIMTLARHLPVPRVFDAPCAPDPSLTDVNYFVICGSIEPRKNHGLLINVWRGLVRDMGASAPHLVIIGSPGWRSEEILEPIRESEPLRRHVHVACGLSSLPLKRLIAGAIGLLMPSHAEGFGLPLIEATRLGVPVIASDIAAHREVVDASALLLDPTAIHSWDKAIRAWALGGRPQVEGRPAQAASDDREAYFATVENFLSQCATRRYADRVLRGEVSARRPPPGDSVPGLETALPNSQSGLP